MIGTPSRVMFNQLLPGQTFTKDGRRWIKVAQFEAYPLHPVTGMAQPANKIKFAPTDYVAEVR